MSHFSYRHQCPICEGLNFETVYECDFTEDPIRDYLLNFYPICMEDEIALLSGEKFSIAQCDNCTTVFQLSVPNEFLLTRIYEKWTEQSQDKISKDKRSLLAYTGEIITLIKYFPKNPLEISVLDFGCGFGEWLDIASALQLNTVGCEFSKHKLQILNKKRSQTIAYETIQNENFDFINCEQIFEHLADPVDTLRHLAKGLSADGIIKISVPEGRGILGKLRRNDWRADKNHPNYLNPIAPLEHLNCFTYDTLRTLGKTCGLKQFNFTYRIRNAVSVDRKMLVTSFKNRIKPFYEKLFRKGTCLFFRKAAE